MSSIASTELLSALSNLYLSNKYSDMAIVCNDQRYPVHKALLCSRSTFFEGACNGRFAESSTGEIDLSEEDEEAVEHMVHYFYHLDYLTPDKDDVEGPAPQTKSSRPLRFTLNDIQDPLLSTAAAVSLQTSASQPSRQPDIAFGSIIPMPPRSPPRSRSPSPKRRTRRFSARPQSNSRSRTRRRSDANGTKPQLDMHTPQSAVSNGAPLADTADLVVHARVYALAEKYGVSGLKALAKEKFEVIVAHRWNQDDFLDAAMEVYTHTIDSDRGLRNVVIQAFRQRPELTSNNDVREVVQELPSLASDLHRMSNGIPVAT